MKNRNKAFGILAVALALSSCFASTDKNSESGDLTYSSKEVQAFSSQQDDLNSGEDVTESIVVTEQSPYDSSDEYMLIEESFGGEDELINYLIKSREDQPDELFESSQRSDGEQLIMYSFNDIPHGYELVSAKENGNFMTYDYINESDNSKLTFVWGFLTEGDEYLKNAIEMFGLTEIPDRKGYYYSLAMDDTGTYIYQIYWSQDGYCFQLNIPTSCMYIELDEETAMFLPETALASKEALIELEVTKKTYPIE